MIDLGKPSHIAAAATAVAVEQVLTGIHQEAGFAIGIQPQSHPSTATEGPDRLPILSLQIVQQRSCCFNSSRAWRFTDFLPRSAEYGRAHSDPRQGWWVSAKGARRELWPSPSTTRSAVAVVPIGARLMDRVGGSDPGSAVLLAQQSRRHRS